MKELLDMFLTFARIGGFTFGGGYAMLPMLQKEVVNGRHWATDEELMDYYAIGQCTPGIIAVNTATFVGYKNRGIPGAIAATLGVIAPSLVIIMIIAAFISNFIELSAVSSAFAGIRACVCVLIGSAVVKLAKKSLVDKGAIAIAAVVFVLSLFTSVSPWRSPSPHQDRWASTWRPTSASILKGFSADWQRHSHWCFRRSSSL